MSTHHAVAEIHHKSSKKLLQSYTIGFVLSVIAVIAAFTLVEKKIVMGESLYFSVAALSLVQLLIQAVFFLRLNARSEDDQWNLLIFLFTILIVLIVVIGALWIMYNLNYYMMH